MIYFLQILFVISYSTLLYVFLHKKTNISLNYLFKDNVVCMILSLCVLCFVYDLLPGVYVWGVLFIGVPMFCVGISIIRFYRMPYRQLYAKEDEIVSPADGNIIYIKKIESGVVPMSVKNGVTAKLDEFLNTNIMDYPCWIIGINMTPLDVHRNCAPIDGKIILNRHIDGDFLSLKNENALIKNERNTIILETKIGYVGVVQTASRLVRRIVTYKKEGECLSKGEWYGMIKFGSQVDLILPATCKINVHLKEQVYAKRTIISKI